MFAVFTVGLLAAGVPPASAQLSVLGPAQVLSTKNVSIAVVSSSVAAASVITTSVPHALLNGDTIQSVTITGHAGSVPNINGTYPKAAISVLSPTTFSIPVNVTAGGTGGSAVYTVPAIKGLDSGYDPVNDVFLVVTGYDKLFGYFVNRLGVAVTSRFFLQPSPGGAHFPRVRYSPDVNGGSGGFLVTYSVEHGGGTNTLHARVVAYPGTLVGAEQTLSDTTSHPWIESGPAVAYSPTSQRFLVAWKTYPTPLGTPIHVAARLVDLTGAPVGNVVKLSSGFARDPGVTWNSATDEFGVSFNAENGAGTYGFSVFVKVSPADANNFLRFSFNTQPAASFTFISDIDFNPDTGRYVMTWWQAPAGVGPETRMAEIDASGNVVSEGQISTRLGSYDALSIAFNPISRTFLLGGLDRTDDSMIGVELNSRGYLWIAPPSNFTLIAGGVTVRYPRVSANSELAEWNVVFNNNYQTLVDAGVGTATTGGGPPGSYGGGSGGTGGPLNPVCITPQPGPGWTCVNGDWQPPTAGIDESACAASPKPGPGWICLPNGDWVPPGSTGSGSTGSGSTSPTPTSTCTTTQPDPTWVCVNGNWVPPSMAPPPPPPPAPSCTTVQPDPTWVCVNGNWVPPSMAPPPPPPPAPSCTTVQPDPTWVCVNGNWLPPSMAPPPPPPAPSCTTPQPGANWVCVNGNWLPPGSTGGTSTGGTSTGGTTTTVTCTTVQPGANWVCVNGNWLPPGSTGGTTTSGTTTGGTTTTSTCTTVQPGANWTCVNGNWLPPGYTGGGDDSLVALAIEASAVTPLGDPVLGSPGWLPTPASRTASGTLRATRPTTLT